jgi:hypothetical protein
MSKSLRFLLQLLSFEQKLRFLFQVPYLGIAFLLHVVFPSFRASSDFVEHKNRSNLESNINRSDFVEHNRWSSFKSILTKNDFVEHKNRSNLESNINISDFIERSCYDVYTPFLMLDFIHSFFFFSFSLSIFLLKSFTNVCSFCRRCAFCVMNS